MRKTVVAMAAFSAFLCVQAGETNMAEVVALQKKVHDLENEIKRLSAQMKSEKYGLRWVDCPEAFEAESENKIPILAEVPGKAIKNNDGKPTHILIEGDNYHALTCLNFTHRGKIDVIYIDPPYNTGSDGFTYKDKRFLTKYPDGEKIDKNHPLRHSAWLSFMSKRLRLAKDLLSDRGVIFISIDDNEMANLKLLCDQIFGEDNVEMMIWHKVDNDSGKLKITHRFRIEHEYILAVYRNRVKNRFHKFLRKRNYKNKYTNPDNDPRGEYKQGIISDTEAKSSPDSKNYYSVTTPSGKVYTRRWRMPKEEFNALRADNRIYFGKRGDAVPSLKVFINEEGLTTPVSILENLGTAKTAGQELLELFNGEKVFLYPKPVALLQHLIAIASNPNDVILDFFAGSGTTGHAVSKLNSEVKSKRRFILVTNNENEICEKVTYERNKRVIEGYKTAKGEDVAGLGGSLKYYKTEFVGKHRSEEALDEDRAELAAKAGALLAMAEETLEEKPLPKKQAQYWQWFTDDNHKHTLIYFSDDLSGFESLVETADKIRAKDKAARLTVYVFAIGSVEGFENEFDDMRHIALKPIPEPILAIYRAINGD